MLKMIRMSWTNLQVYKCLRNLSCEEKKLPKKFFSRFQLIRVLLLSSFFADFQKTLEADVSTRTLSKFGGGDSLSKFVLVESIIFNEVDSLWRQFLKKVSSGRCIGSRKEGSQPGPGPTGWKVVGSNFGTRKDLLLQNVR